ncbi:MAG TPA: hypothetical protein ENO23_05715, partial [Alphaproteobacteria bacterium]|nr:hypothetical protein [Alphaproteobacteria bacterium]
MERDRTDEARAAARVGWVTDVQNDFMRPPEEGGRLYVAHLEDPSDEGAVQVRPAIERAVRWMEVHCEVIVYTT